MFSKGWNEQQQQLTTEEDSTPLFDPFPEGWDLQGEDSDTSEEEQQMEENTFEEEENTFDEFGKPNAVWLKEMIAQVEKEPSRRREKESQHKGEDDRHKLQL
eukprot:9591543-Heterocapsa_arctica.AAC.1